MFISTSTNTFLGHTSHYLLSINYDVCLKLLITVY